MPKPEPDTEMTAVRLLKKWPDTGSIASDLKISHFTVAAWLRRESIPIAHWEGLVKAARRRGIVGVSYAVFRTIAVQSKLRKRAAASEVKASCAPGHALGATSIKGEANLVQHARANIGKKFTLNTNREKTHAA
jgi:hypothetical protein